MIALSLVVARVMPQGMASHLITQGEATVAVITAQVTDAVTSGDYQIIERGGLIGFLFLAIVGFMKEWWVPGSIYHTERAERVRLQNLVEQQTLPVLAKVAESLSAKVPSRHEG